MFIEFTRSTGCGWCIKLEKEVLNQAEFKTNIPKHYVLVVLNIPRDRSSLSAEQQKHYNALIERYQVRSYPYLVFADASGRPYKGKSYRDGKEDRFLEKTIEVQSRKERRDFAFTEAQKAEGTSKARLLEKGLSEVSSKYYHEYPEILKAIAEADPSDISGFLSKVRTDAVRNEIERLLTPLFHERKFAEIPEVVDRYISENQPKDKALQVAMLYKVRAFYMDKQYAKAAKVADGIIGINDASRAARYAKIIKKRIVYITEEVKEEIR